MAAIPFGLAPDQFDAVLEAACRAPSLHNAQPWSFRADADSIEVHLDHARLIPVADPEHAEARLGCGAALFNLRLALLKVGIAPKVAMSARVDGPLAVVRSGGPGVLSPDLAALERAIVVRRTNRRPFFDAEVPVGHQLLLCEAAATEGESLHPISSMLQLATVRQWATTAHRMQQADPAWVAEFRAWTGRVDAPDGVPLTAAGPAPAPQDAWALKDFGSPGRPERVGGRDFEELPMIAVLATSGDGPMEQLRAGQALQRVLLSATSLGLAVSFLSQLVEVPAARAQLRSIIGGRTHPQAVLRIGFGLPVPATPRRPAAECLLA